MDETTKHNVGLLYNYSNSGILGVDKRGELYTIKWYNFIGRLINFICDPRGAKVGDVAIKTLQAIKDGVEIGTIQKEPICTIFQSNIIENLPEEVKKLLLQIEHAAFQSDPETQSERNELKTKNMELQLAIERFKKTKSFRSLPVMVQDLFKGILSCRPIFFGLIKRDPYRHLIQDEANREVNVAAFAEEMHDSRRFQTWMPFMRIAPLSPAQDIYNRVNRLAVDIGIIYRTK